LSTSPALPQTYREKLCLWSDGFAAAVAAALPWSTSATLICLFGWLLVTLPTLSVSDIRREITSWAGGLPVLLVLFAAVGMLWSEAVFEERVAGFAFFYRLLFIPLLMAHFRRSQHLHWLLYAFLGSSALLLLSSFLLYNFPIYIKPHAELMTAPIRAVPVKDYIVQSGIFVLCASGLGYAAFVSWRAGRKMIALGAMLLVVLFLFNITFVVTGRTALAILPFLVLLLGFRACGWKGVAGALVATAVLAGVVWASSPYLRERVTALAGEMKVNRTDAAMSSSGQRIEFWRKSIRFIASAPAFGHGTGSIEHLFAQAAAGQTGAAGLVADNPHQQTFTVAIQLGIAGAAVLWAMWISHLLLFRGTSIAAWLGLVVVVENILGSLVNSHLFDFTPGWIYVLGVGALGGAMRQREDREKARN
jgi:O-antigen ligase